MMITFRQGIIALALVGSLWSVEQAQARYNSDERQAIKASPILDRPYRVGHFYGNTVRRRYSRSHDGMVEDVTVDNGTE